MRLLLVEDEPAVATGLVDVLRLKGYEVTHVGSGEEALALEERFDLILLDAGLPGLSGFQVLRTWRQRQDDTPVLMLTARGTEADRVLGFELGVDDYVVKPFSLLELLGRIGAILRRVRPQATGLRVGTAVVDLERFTVNGQPGLPARAFRLLEVLAARQGQVVERERLMDEVWGAEEAISLRTLNNLVVKIRQAVEPDPDSPRHLLTVHGVGYRLEL